MSQTRVLPFILLFLLVSTALFAQKKQRLFDGKTFNGWHTIPGGNWAIKEGVIVGTAEKSDPRHGLLVTDKRFKDFKISILYKAVKGNSGLYFRIDEVGGEVGVNGFQAEIDPIQDAGGLYETGDRGWVVQPKPEDVKKWYKPNDWNKMEVIAKGQDITVFVNGIKTAELKNDPSRAEGHIALQLHGSQDMEVYFKKIMLEEL